MTDQKIVLETFVSTKNSILEGSFTFDGNYNSLDNHDLMIKEEDHQIVLNNEQISNKKPSKLSKVIIESDEKDIYKIGLPYSPASTMSNGSYSKYLNILESNIEQIAAFDDNEKAKIVSKLSSRRESKKTKNIAIPEEKSGCLGCNLI